MSAYNTLLGDEEAGWGPSNKNNNNYADPSFSFAEKQVRLGFVRKVFGKSRPGSVKTR